MYRDHAFPSGSFAIILLLSSVILWTGFLIWFFI